MFTKKQPESKKAPSQSFSTTNPSNAQLNMPSSSTESQKKTRKTKIHVKYDVGFGNILYLRGNGGNLSWDRGIPMKNVKADEWVWETELEFPPGEYKVLINDAIFETGQNHALYCGTTTQHTPHF